MFNPRYALKQALKRRRRKNRASQPATQQEEFKYDAAMFWVTFAGVIVVAGSVGVGLWNAILVNGQLGVAENTLSDAEAAASSATSEQAAASERENRLISANEAMANAANRSANSAKDAEEKQLRPYLDFIPGGPTDKPIPFMAPTAIVDKPVMGMVAIKNQGQTPARNIVLTADFDLLDTSIGAQPNYKFTETVISRGSAMSVNASKLLTPHLKRPLTKDEVQGWFIGTKAFFLHATVTYRDSFSVEHRTRFCLFIPKGDIEGNFCEGHNDNN